MSTPTVPAAGWTAFLLALAAAVSGCGAPPAAEAPPAISSPSGSSNWFCRGLADHFAGLPSAQSEDGGPTPLVGR